VSENLDLSERLDPGSKVPWMPIWTDVQGYVALMMDLPSITPSPNTECLLLKSGNRLKRRRKGLRGVTRRDVSGPGSRVCKLAQRLEANDPDRYTTLALTDAAENGSSSNRPPQVKSAHFQQRTSFRNFATGRLLVSIPSLQEITHVPTNRQTSDRASAT
jgi:hypothetical protein